MKRLVALVLVLALAVTAALGAPPAAAADSAVVVMYHRFGESDYPSTNIAITQFEAHLEELRSGGYTVLPVPEILDALRRGDPLAEGTVGLTVDDAFLSVYREAWPRLRAAGLPFTLFVATDAVDRGSDDYMTWDQVRELAAAGVVIGGHGASHPHMAGAADDANRDQLERAAARFAEELGRQPELFAYPYGEASLAVATLVREAGFGAAFGQHSGAIGGGGDFYNLPRFALNEKYGDLARFRMVVRARVLAVRDVTPADPLIGTNNPPAYGFTLADPLGDASRLACYASHEGRVRVESLGEGRFEVRMSKPFPKGRTRVNCTLPTADGGWRWLGRQFYVP